MLLLLLAALLASGSALAAPDPGPCRASLPHGPAVPAPIVFRTSCGAFRLDREGEVERLPRRWLSSRSGGTGGRYGADLRIGRNGPGRILIRREGRVVWRSSGLYHRDGGSVAFGPGSFAFASWRRGIFLTDLNGPERLVAPGVGLHPLAFLRGGELLVVKGGWGPSVSVLSRDGSLLRRYRYRPRNVFAFDERTDSLFFVTPGRMLARADGADLRLVRPLRGLEGWLSLTGPNLTLQTDDTFAVVRRDGTLVSRWSWPTSRKSTIDMGFYGSDDARTFAFRTVTRGPRGMVVVQVLRHGETRPRQVFRHRGGPVGCGVGASFAWHGPFLLYSSTNGPAAVVDVRDGSARALTAVAAKLPGGRAPAGVTSANWESDFARP